MKNQKENPYLEINTKIQKREKYPILIQKEKVIPKIGPGNEKRVQGLGRDYCKTLKMWNCFIPLKKVVVVQPKIWEQDGNS